MQSKQDRPQRPSMLRRYGPIIAVVVVVAIVAVVVAVTSGGDGGNKKAPVSAGGVGRPPTLFSRDSKIDWGPNCDTRTGRVAIPSIYAPPCVEPFHGNNGGATSPGVTADSITIAVYVNQNDPLQQAFVSGAGANVTPEVNADQAADFARIYEAHYELYGRKLNIVKYHANGGPTDEAAAKADAIKIATDIKPFAVFGAPTQTSAFADELTARKILCIGNCAGTYPESFLLPREPYMWQFGPTSSQSAALSAELIGKELQGKNASHGGPDVQGKPRVFGILHYNTPDGQFSSSYQNFVQQLGKFKVKPAADVAFSLDLNRAPELARNAIAQLKSAGVTSVILNADPLMPKYFTQEATRQGWFPEWVLGPSLFVDTALFGRTYDAQQWPHAFGISYLAARGQQQTANAYNLYRWQYGKPPPSNIYEVTNFDPSIFGIGVHLAGPILTPETFQAGLFRYPVTGGGPTTPTLSRGSHGLWPTTDFGGIDDAVQLWWDPNASGPDEAGNRGKGLYQYADGGKRYRPGQFPRDEAGLFDTSKAVSIFETLPPSDRPPTYPSPAR
jgi:hypothetical protein